MKKQVIIFFATIVAMLVSATADTFFMKDGTKINGTLVRKDLTSYFVEIHVTKTIKDEKTLLKKDVIKIETEPLDLKVFPDILKLLPVPDMMPITEYASRIKKAEIFLVDHADSSKLKEAKVILETLKLESGQIAAGGIKMKGKMISPEEYRANAYEIEAAIQESRIRSLVEAGQALNALRGFSEFEKDFRNTVSYVSLIPLMTRVIQSYLNEVGDMQATLEKRIKTRQLGLERMAASDRSMTENAIKEENANLELSYKQQKDGKLGWVSIHPFFKASLDETMTYGKQELIRLGAVGKETPVDGGKLFRDALSLIQSGGEASAIAASIAAAEAANIPAKYIAILKSTAPKS